jgi:NAD(P)-dependent dehydrogenase (short-subunit alcohol dehydrogenase family)
MQGIAGTVAVVTGAAGGIGRATSDWLCENGARVFDLDVRPPADGRGAFVEVNVRDAASVGAAVQHVLRQAGQIDHAVVAAGVSEQPTAAEDMDAEVWDRTIAINLTGAFLTCQAVGRSMLAARQGRIVTIASMSGNHVVNTPQRQVAYNASKAAVVAMTKSLAYEWADRGVRVNALSPGYVDTPLLGSKHEMHELWKHATPVKRFATPAEVAAAIGYLLSDEAAFYCGAELLMDGGYSLA